MAFVLQVLTARFHRLRRGEDLLIHRRSPIVSFASFNRPSFIIRGESDCGWCPHRRTIPGEVNSNFVTANVCECEDSESAEEGRKEGIPWRTTADANLESMERRREKRGREGIFEVLEDDGGACWEDELVRQLVSNVQLAVSFLRSSRSFHRTSSIQPLTHLLRHPLDVILHFDNTLPFQSPQPSPSFQRRRSTSPIRVVRSSTQSKFLADLLLSEMHLTINYSMARSRSETGESPIGSISCEHDLSRPHQ